MSNTPRKLPPEARDDLAHQLRESLERKRPRRARIVLVVALLTVALGVALWFFYPTEETIRLQAVAYDTIGVPGRKVLLHGGLDAHEAKAVFPHREIQFLDAGMLAKPGQDVKPFPVRTDAKGHGSTEWTFPGDPFQAEFIVRILGDRRRPGTEDRGRVVFPSPGTPFCFVQIEETLTTATDQTWKKANLIDIPPRPEAGPVLAHLRKKGIQIVYLAMHAERPLLYQKMRGWARHQAKEGAVPFPAGPVLGRFELSKEQQSRPWEHGVRPFVTAFPEPTPPGHLAIAGTPEAAQQLHAAGCTTYYVGEAEQLPAQVRRATDWKALQSMLEK